MSDDNNTVKEGDICPLGPYHWRYVVRFDAMGPRLTVYHTVRFTRPGWAEWEPPFEFRLTELPNEHISADLLDKIGFYEELEGETVVPSFELEYKPLGYTVK